MGRPPSPPRLNKKGAYECWHPAIKKYVKLGTSDFAEASRIQQGFYGVVQASTPILPDIPSRDNIPDVDMGKPMIINLDENDDKPKDAANLLAGWAKSSSPMAPPTPVASSPVGTVYQTPISAGHPQNGPGIATMVTKSNKVPKGLTPEQSAKIANGLKKMVVNTNVVVIGAAVQMFGVVPAPLDREEIELLQLGWELWLDELFNKAKLKPVYLVVVGNIMIAISMYAAGERMKKPDPKTDPSKAKSAPGHEATVHPITPPKG